MHEFSIINNIVNILNDFIINNNIKKVNIIKLKIGKFAGISESSLRFYFNIINKNSIYENAELVISNYNLLFYCNNCKKEIQKDFIILNCPDCGEDLIVKDCGDKLIIESIEYED